MGSSAGCPSWSAVRRMVRTMADFHAVSPLGVGKSGIAGSEDPGKHPRKNESWSKRAQAHKGLHPSPHRM